MSEFKSSAGYRSTTGGADGGLFMVHTPVWCTVVRGFQAFFGFIILILAGLLIHGLALDAVVFALVCGLFTMIVVTYALVSEKAPNCRSAYNIWAHLSLDLFMAILWLSSMGANAALRATFTVNVNADCWDDGSAVNAGHCIVSRSFSGLSKRYAVAGKGGLAQMSAVAGLSALEMLLFIATLVYNGHAFRMHHQEKKARGGDIGHMEMKGQQDPSMNAPQHQTSQQYAQYSDQNQYVSQVYQQQPLQAQQQPYDPTYYEPKQPQTAVYAVATQQPHEVYGGGAYPQQTTSDQFQQQSTYSPHTSPVQQHQAYLPPR
ncbi:hypothetical protein GE09DRAFT_1230330 [Coniochaeta sp. 2T2.1]|nr:hypothetical protein GE09DRAFT_1230330 [Coniochaeta sp. 2T2.1]